MLKKLIKTKSFGIEELIILPIAIVLAFIVVEKSVQTMFWGENYIWLPETTAEFNPDPSVLPGVGGIAQLRINGKGFRGTDKIRGDEQIIISLGGESTEGLFLDQNETWPHLLQNFLNTEDKEFLVWNGGKTGKNSFDHISDLKHTIDSVENIHTVIILMGANDFLYCLSGKDYTKLNVPWYQKTYIYRGAAKFKNRFDYPHESTKLDYNGYVFEEWRYYRRQSNSIISQLPDLQKALKLYRKNIEKLHSISLQHNIKLVFLTQPYFWKKNMTDREKRLIWRGGVSKDSKGKAEAYYSVEALAKGMSLFNQQLKRTCKQLNIPCLDLEARTPKNTSIFFDDIQFNESGSYFVAKTVYSGILAKEIE